MDLSLSDDAEALGRLTGDILRDAPHQQLSGDADRGGETTTWAALARAGVLGASLAADVGGEGLGSIETHVVLEQIGAHATRLPVFESIVLGAHTIDRFGNAQQRRRWLPGVAAGRVWLTAALHEPGPTNPAGPRAHAAATSSGWLVSGTKTQVIMAAHADRVLVPASTDDGRTVVLLVDPKTPGVTATEQTVTGHLPASLLELREVPVTAEDALGGDGPGEGVVAAEVMADLILRAEAGLASMQSGVLAAVLRLACEHVRTREQFGRPIGAFQAVRQRLADAWIDAESVRLTALHAAYLIGRAGANASIDSEVVESVAIAKWCAAQAGHRVLHTAHHVHGGTGIDLSYPLHRYFRFGKHIEFTLGNASTQLGVLGQLLADDRATV